ncbi:hypothetical protein ACFWOG_03605 [Kitasatospora sp. NPDC058406]|uniref:hypothetical protein n=1 Tax=Kitasatospora sp. NPDC058406 TaxID=3346483 RepID=UPI00366A0B2B
MIRHHQVTVSYASLCLAALGGAVIEHYTPGSTASRAAQHSVLFGSLAGLTHLTVHASKWATRRFLARLAKKLQEMTMDTDTRL